MVATARELIALNIKRFRKANGLSVDEVGAAVGRSGKTVSAWEVCVGQPDADMLLSLCALFGVEIADFFSESPETKLVAEKELTGEESELIFMFRAMSKPGRDALLATAASLHESFGSNLAKRDAGRAAAS